MKLFLRILKWTIVGVICITLVVFLYFYFIFFARPSVISKLDEVHDNKWHTVLLKGKSMCSDGSEYAVFVKKGSSKNVIIHFSGGGACWDGNSADKIITIRSVFNGYSKDLKAFYFSKLQFFYPKALTGLIDNESPNNAFRDWNVVFIPYCTGDLHIGNAINDYSFNGKEIKIYHNGRNNSLASLNWAFDNFKNVEKILVSGESSGAWASAFWVPYIADYYPNNIIYNLSDGVSLYSNRWEEILDTVWKSDSYKFLGIKVGKDVFEDALIHRTDTLKRNIKYLHSNTLYDDTHTRFSAVLNHKPTNTNKFIDDWAANTKASMKRLSESGIEYNYFLTDWGHNLKTHTTQHTLSTNEFYHTCSADGISYADWLKRTVIDDENLSLGKKLLEN